MTLFGSRNWATTGDSFPASAGPSASCPECGRGTSTTHQLFVDYFNGRSVACANAACGAAFDLWNSMTASRVKMQYSGTSNAAIATIGVVTLADIEVTAGALSTVRLADFGVPPTALVLDVTTSHPVIKDGRFEAIEWPSRPRIRLGVPHTFDLYGVAFGKIERGSLIRVQLNAHWVDTEFAPDAAQCIAQAVAAFGERRYDLVPVPANTAVELSVDRLLAERMNEVGITKKELAESAYHAKLNTLVPRVSGHLNQPRLPDAVGEALNKLRQFRNEVGHSGRTKLAMTPELASQCLASAIFGVEYTAMLSGAADPLSHLARPR